MTVQTLHNNTYSYLRRSNEIVPGIVDDSGYVWTFEPLQPFSAMPDVYMFIIAITEQCNLRCTYCCYSGEYEGNHKHGIQSMSSGDIDGIYSFIDQTAADKAIRISFYGGEPLIQYALMQYAVAQGRERWGDKVAFSVSTNGALLSEDRIGWLESNGVEIAISVDGSQRFHDEHRVDASGRGSFAEAHRALDYILHLPDKAKPQVAVMMTLPSIDALEAIAKEWHEDYVLSHYAPTRINGLSPNFAKGVSLADYEELRGQYLHLLGVYQQHHDWVVLRTFFEECVADWKNRQIFDVDGDAPMSTCMPLNTKIYIDANMQLAVCEKFNDRFRIGSVKYGIDWDKANRLVDEYYKRREKRCAECPVLRMCSLCLTAVEYTDEQWDTLCHNERTYARLNMLLLCEMAERRLIA